MDIVVIGDLCVVVLFRFIYVWVLKIVKGSGGGYVWLVGGVFIQSQGYCEFVFFILLWCGSSDDDDDYSD